MTSDDLTAATRRVRSVPLWVTTLGMSALIVAGAFLTSSLDVARLFILLAALAIPLVSLLHRVAGGQV